MKLVGMAQQCKVERIAIGNHLAQPRMRNFTVTRRVDIARTTRKEDTVKPRRVLGEYIRRTERGNHHGQAAGGQHGLQVETDLARRVFILKASGYSDPGFCHFQIQL